MRWPGQLISKLIWSGILLAAAFLTSEPALAAKRVALIIGNSTYQNAPQLANPANDAALMAATFKSAGFDVVDSRQNLTALDTRRVLREFADAAQNADVAVVYYAGHGLEVDGTNYLVPVDAKLERDTDVYDEALSLDRLLIAVEPAKQLRLVILDACRDNPFIKNMKRATASRSIDRGLAKIEPSSPNMLIAYSAKAGSTAADGDSRNSPFSIALSKHLTTPGLDIRKAFGYVRDDVLKATANHQEPFVYGSLGGDEVPLVPAKTAPGAAEQPAAAALPAANPQAEARRDYELALQIGNKSAFNAFLAQYPDGFYASLARLQLDRLVTEEAHALAEAKAKAAEAERARLAATGAGKDTQAKADADARAAEQARLATEQAQQVAQAQAAEAERNRIALATAAPAATPAPAAATPSPSRATNVASLDTGSPQGDLTRSLQSELRRVGCLTTSTDGDWNAASQRSLTQFNRYSGTKFDTKTASVDALDAVKQKSSRVCPLSCEHGFKADGDQCTRIVCADGSFLNDDNQCEKRRDKKPVASRDRQDTPRVRPQAQQAPQAPQAQQPKQSMAGRPQGAFSGASPGTSRGRALTGDEREQGCNSYQAIMSGVCP
jgi:uncharacterized caspase-like protein